MQNVFPDPSTIDAAEERRLPPHDRNLFIRSLLPALIAAIIIAAALLGRTVDYPTNATLPCDLSCVGLNL